MSEDDRDHWRLKSVSLDDGWDWHDGAGFYLYLEEYPEEGTVGSFRTRDEALAWIRESDGVLVDRHGRAS